MRENMTFCLSETGFIYLIWSSPFFFVKNSIVYVHRIFFIHSIGFEHLAWFHNAAVINNIKTNSGMPSNKKISPRKNYLTNSDTKKLISKKNNLDWWKSGPHKESPQRMKNWKENKDFIFLILQLS